MKISVKILSVIFAVIMLIGVLPTSASARTIEEIQADIEAQQKKLDELEAQKDKQEDYVDALNEQIKDYDAQLDIINSEVNALERSINKLNVEINEYEVKISGLEVRIGEIDAQIEVQNVEIEATYELLAERIKASQMAGETSELEVFLSATDFQDFINRTELLRQIAKHDAKIVEDLRDQIDELNKMNEQLEKDKADLVSSKSKLDADKQQLLLDQDAVLEKKSVFDAKKAEVEAKIKKANGIIAELDQNSDAVQKLLAEAKREEEEFSASQDDFIGNNGSTGSGNIDNGVVDHNFRVSSKGMICPLQDKSTYISSGYQSHLNTSRSKAIDLCAPGTRVINGKTYYNVSRGAKIYAVATGTILKVSYDSRSGNFFIIDHGNGVTTLYAHCDSINVSAGQKVVQGQVVAAVGNTGYVIPGPTASNPSAGAHLHFEVRVGGVRQNPEVYMPSPLV